MKISDVTYAPTYFDAYISQVADLELSEALQQSLEAIDALDLDKLHALGDRVNELPVLAVGFTLGGHQNHHIRILEEPYFPILQTV